MKRNLNFDEVVAISTVPYPINFPIKPLLNATESILFNGDLVYVEGIYKGLDDLGNPYLELTQFSLMEPVE